MDETAYLGGAPQRALIDEPQCIGCTKCIQACPVDAIVGAAKQMHTVIISQCTGCELCLPPCPVDCIALLPTAGWSDAQDANARRRFADRQRRLQRDQHLATRRQNQNQPHNTSQPQQASPTVVPIPAPQQLDATAKRAVIAAAVARARAKRAGTRGAKSSPPDA